MTAKQIYEKETGDKSPSDQIGYSDWYIDYVKWLEKRVVSQANINPDLLPKAMLALDDYLNAGEKETRKQAAENAKLLYKEYY